MVLRRLAAAIDQRPKGYQRRRAVLTIAATEFVRQARPRTGKQGTPGFGGWDLSHLAHAAFWSLVLVSHRRDRLAMTLLGQVHPDTAAVRPYVQEKKATQEILDALPALDADSLIGFVDVAVTQFLPPGVSGEPLVPGIDALEILKAALLRGAMVGELAPDAVRDAWLAAHPESADDPERHWKIALGRAETLYRSWQQKRRAQGKRLV